MSSCDKKIQVDWEIIAKNIEDDGTTQIRSFKEKHKRGFKHKN